MPERIEQSVMIMTFLNNIQGKKILCGDFNALPGSKSIGILEQGMKNLIKEFNVTSTRSRLYLQPVKFADYIFISPDASVKEFRTLPVEVSDHLSLFLDFS